MVCRAHRSPRESSSIKQLSYRHLRNPYPPMLLDSDDEIESIHQASLTLLRDTGMRFLLPEAREILKQAGAQTSQDSERVRFEPELLMELVANSPFSFTLHARNPDHSLFFGENAVNFEIWKQILTEYQQLELEQGRAEQLNEFVEKRKTEGSAPSL